MQCSFLKHSTASCQALRPWSRSRCSVCSIVRVLDIKLQLAIAWKAASGPMPHTPNQLPPCIHCVKKGSVESRSSWHVWYTVNRRGQTPETVFHKYFRGVNFKRQLVAPVWICSYRHSMNITQSMPVRADHKGYLKPNTASCNKLG